MINSNGISISTGNEIFRKASKLKLDPGMLYESVIDISAEGLLTANAINTAAGILLDELGLPGYFFENITYESLKSILRAIAGSITFINGKAVLQGYVAQVDFDIDQGEKSVKVRIATENTREDMEKLIGPLITGHRREYYYSPSSNYHTYIIGPETVKDSSSVNPENTFTNEFNKSPKATINRYDSFLKKKKESIIPLIKVYNLPETRETRIMLNSDFALPQLGVLRKILESHKLTLIRAYWEPYAGNTISPSSICSLYVAGCIEKTKEEEVKNDLCAFLAFSCSHITELFINGKLSFQEMLFAGNAVSFTHYFIYKERLNNIDNEILRALNNADQRDSFTSRIHNSNKSEYFYELINEVVFGNTDLIKFLYRLFKSKFGPNVKNRITDKKLEEKYHEFEKIISVRFLDSEDKKDIFNFMFKMINCCLKTNFYKERKRSFAFRCDNRILDPIVFDQPIYGIFYVNGHYSCGTHLRAADISRGGLRMIRVTDSNYHSELDKAVLLNYALGPKAQRLKHKDICESGSKGVIVPKPIYAKNSLDALYDYTDGIMDLMLGDELIEDYLGKPEMIFFGPDEGTAPFMDNVSFHAKKKGYKFWRTITTGKSFGIPHDTYGMLENGDIFGLISKNDKGVDLQINGKSRMVTNDMDKIYREIGGKITHSGMTTTCIMSSFRKLISHYGEKEEKLNLMMTGGPDGDLGANEIQCYKGKICLIIDGGSILFDPDGLDRKALMKIAFHRNSSPRANSLDFPVDKLGKRGFMVPRLGKNIKLADGTIIDDGSLFHCNFLTDPSNRKYIKEADIRAFIPCGGFKDTVNYGNIENFVSNFKELNYIVEGANVFFDDAARRYISKNTNIKQIKDSTANKGGVMSSSISEVLTAFLLKEDYDSKLNNNLEARWALIKEMMDIIADCAAVETAILIKIHEKTSEPLFELTVKTSEQIYLFQEYLYKKLPEILKNQVLCWKVMEAYIPPVLVRILGENNIIKTMNSKDMMAYKDAIITKKLASMALYKYGIDWDSFLAKIDSDFLNTLKNVVK